ncbi:MAG: ATP-dependent protease ATPase subunit HslU [Clostridia bacterium]|nr:ATP-dependent protease ATPase subunit HslU [Clostridia bacterium]MDD4686132.1 ATP-dependent protease ATPase subunit HslU [Clostridia bacterium]
MNLSPKEIVQELNKYIIGQSDAKRAVAVALRNRYRRSKLPKEIREEITPKNIIMKGPTGVGKTEIARRLAKLVKAPFIKIEATKYTEVGYVGRDVESMVRDLVEMSVRMVKDEKQHQVESKAKPIVDNKILDTIFISKLAGKGDISDEELKNKIKADYESGKLDDEIIEIEVSESIKPIGMAGGIAEINLNEIFGGFMPKKKKNKRISVKRAKELLFNEECDRQIDQDNVNSEAIRRAEEHGIIFIDEMDKIIGKSATDSGPDVSREGVQRDILPIVEGSTIATKYGNIKTDFILFIAAGAFHISKIEDMIPELQGRFPIKVELSNLTKNDFKNILSQPKNSITFQYASLLKVDNIDLKFTDDSLDEIAEMAEQENSTSENIGARRLHTILERLIEDISFNANGKHPLQEITIDKQYVKNAFSETRNKYDLRKYIL